MWDERPSSSCDRCCVAMSLVIRLSGHPSINTAICLWPPLLNVNVSFNVSPLLWTDGYLWADSGLTQTHAHTHRADWHYVFPCVDGPVLRITSLESSCHRCVCAHVRAALLFAHQTGYLYWGPHTPSHTRLAQVGDADGLRQNHCAEKKHIPPLWLLANTHTHTRTRGCVCTRLLATRHRQTLACMLGSFWKSLSKLTF